jgi:hypothetical protein
MDEALSNDSDYQPPGVDSPLLVKKPLNPTQPPFSSTPKSFRERIRARCLSYLSWAGRPDGLASGVMGPATQGSLDCPLSADLGTRMERIVIFTFGKESKVIGKGRGGFGNMQLQASVMKEGSD